LSIFYFFNCNPAKQYSPSSHISQGRIENFLDITYSHFVEGISSLKEYPVPPLFLQAIAEITHFQIIVVTDADDPRYIIKVTPSASKRVKEFGLLRLSHWGFAHWALIEPFALPPDYVSTHIERDVYSHMDTLLHSLSPLSPLQMRDLKFPEHLRKAIFHWTQMRNDPSYHRMKKVFLFGFGNNSRFSLLSSQRYLSIILIFILLYLYVPVAVHAVTPPLTCMLSCYL
jgi:hypothetical protein